MKRVSIAKLCIKLPSRLKVIERRIFLSSWLPSDGIFPKLFVFDEPFHNFRNGFSKENISPRVLNWPSNHIVSETTVTGHHSTPLKVLGPGDDSESITTIVYSINFDHHDTTILNEQITLKYYYIILQEFGFKVAFGWNPQINNWIGTTKTYQTWFPAKWCILRHTSGFWIQLKITNIQTGKGKQTNWI